MVDEKYSKINWSDYFDYFEGFLFWKVSHIRVKPGDLAGTISHNYASVMLYKESYRVHRIIFAMHGNILYKNEDIDHINGDKLDNRYENLRRATRAQNNVNSKTRNRYGVRGVYYNEKTNKYQVQFSINGKKKSLGYFTDIEDAKKTAIEFHREFYKDFSRS